MPAISRVDRFQREHSSAGFPIAVSYKLFDDRGLHLAALVTYYAFVSLFPLLLLFVSAAGFFLDGEPHLRQRLIQSALNNFPGISSQLRENISGFHGSGAALAVGIVGTLYGGLGAMQAAQAAFNQIYGVPRNEQPNPLKSRLRSLGLLGLLGTAVLLSTAIAALAATANGLSAEFGIGLRLVGYALTFVINVALFTGACHLLTARAPHVRQLITGGILAGASWETLQVFGALYVSHEAHHGDSLYGVFGVVLAAIAWIYLQALALMVSAEINAVLHYRLWPRSLMTPFTDDVELTPADQRAYAMYVQVQKFKGFQKIHTDFRRDRREPPAQDGDGLEPEPDLRRWRLRQERRR
ncbi:MAG: YihY/virulence factor BrkB family protein [Acidothermaceae bacterium]